MSEKARKAEAAKTPATFEFQGHTFEIVTDYNEWTLDMHEALEDGKELLVLRAALGPVQWQVLKSLGLKTRQINEFASAATEALGFRSVGESPASSD